MNKLNLLCALSCTAVLTVCGTNAYAADQGAIPVKTTAVSQSENTKSFAVNKVVYEGTNVILSCREIFKDGIEFEVTNTSDSSISLILNIGLDGYSAKLWGDAYEWEIAPNETKVCKMNGDIPHPEHALMSMYGIVFKDYTGIEEFDIYDFDLGGKPNTDAAYPEGTEQFSSDDLTVDYIGADARGVNFAVSNKRDCSITVGFETFTINNEIRNYAISVTTIPPHTEGVYLVDILSYNPAYFSNELKSFEGIMYTVINGNRIDRFPVSSENSGKEAGSNSTQDISEAEKVYNMSLQLHKDQCSKDPSGRYSYDGITFLEDDCNWIDSPLNKDGTVDASVFYRALQPCLENFSNDDSWRSYAEHIVGFTPASEDEFAPYAEELNTFIAPANIPDSIIPKFQSMSTVEVSEDSGTYTCTIKDVADCAEEMKVSEEMFGYILGALHDSGAKIEFSGHSCVVEYKDFRAGSSDN